MTPALVSFLALLSVIESQNKANKDRLRNLGKARLVFQDHLGMEIRTILGKTQLVKGGPNIYMYIPYSVFFLSPGYVIHCFHTLVAIPMKILGVSVFTAQRIFSLGVPLA